MTGHAIGGDWCDRAIGFDGCRMAMGVPVEIVSVAEAAVAGTVGGGAMAIDSGDLYPADRRVAKGTVAGAAVTVDTGDDITVMAACAGDDSGHAIVILDHMILIIGGVWIVAIRTVRGNSCGDGIDDRLTSAVVAGAA